MEMTKELYEALHGGQGGERYEARQRSKMENDVVNEKLNSQKRYSKLLEGLGMGDSEADAYIHSKYLDPIGQLVDQLSEKALAHGTLDKSLNRKILHSINDGNMYKDIAMLKNAVKVKGAYENAYWSSPAYRQQMMQDPNKAEFLAKDEEGNYTNNVLSNYNEMLQQGAAPRGTGVLEDLMGKRRSEIRGHVEKGRAHQLVDDAFRHMSNQDMNDARAEWLYDATRDNPELYDRYVHHNLNATEQLKADSIIKQKEDAVRREWEDYFYDPRESAGGGSGGSGGSSGRIGRSGGAGGAGVSDGGYSEMNRYQEELLNSFAQSQKSGKSVKLSNDYVRDLLFQQGSKDVDLRYGDESGSNMKSVKVNRLNEPAPEYFGNTVSTSLAGAINKQQRTIDGLSVNKLDKLSYMIRDAFLDSDPLINNDINSPRVDGRTQNVKMTAYGHVGPDELLNILKGHPEMSDIYKEAQKDPKEFFKKYFSIDFSQEKKYSGSGNNTLVNNGYLARMNLYKKHVGAHEGYRSIKSGDFSTNKQKQQKFAR